MSINIHTKKRGTINVKYVINKKIPVAQYILTWKTSEESLLRGILKKYITENVFIKGVNSRNKILNAFVGKSGIMILSPENTFFSVINQIYRALLSTVIKIGGNYNKLTSDINKGCEIYITGKITTLLKHFSNNSSTKIEALKKVLDGYDYKDRKSTSNREEPISSFVLETNKHEKFKDIDKYGLAMLVSSPSIDIWFEGNNICTNNINYLLESIRCINFKMLDKLKFRYATGDDKAKEMLDRMFAKLYNFNYVNSDFKECPSIIRKISLPQRVAVD